MFREKFTEIVLTNGASYVVLGNYEKVFKRLFDDSGRLVRFHQIEDTIINVSQIVEIKDYRED